jgi:hypothetical protein
MINEINKREIEEQLFLATGGKVHYDDKNYIVKDIKSLMISTVGEYQEVRDRILYVYWNLHIDPTEIHEYDGNPYDHYFSTPFYEKYINKKVGYGLVEKHFAKNRKSLDFTDFSSCFIKKIAGAKTLNDFIKMSLKEAYEIIADKAKSENEDKGIYEFESSGIDIIDKLCTTVEKKNEDTDLYRGWIPSSDYFYRLMDSQVNCEIIHHWCDCALRICYKNVKEKLLITYCEGSISITHHKTQKSFEEEYIRSDEFYKEN